MDAKKLNPQLLLKKLDDIPSLPGIVYEMSRVINDPMSSTREVEEIMAQDIGMTAKVLKLANSAYYAIPGGVSSLARAIAFIGFDTVHQLVLSTSIIQAVDARANESGFDLTEFWKHSIGVAIGAETIGRFVRYPNPTDLFTAGLVHDIGKIALFLAAPDVLKELIAAAEKKKATYYETEIEFGILPHTEIGKILSEKWRLPKTILAAAKYHHEDDPAKRGFLSSDLQRVVDVVQLSNLLVHALKFGYSGHSKILGAPNPLLDRMMLNPQTDLAPILKQIKEQLDKASDFIRNISNNAPAAAA